MKSPLTPRQKLVFEVFKTGIEKNGFSPTIAEVAAILGRSKATIFECMEAILEKGYLVRSPDLSRGISLPNGPKPLSRQQSIVYHAMRLFHHQHGHMPTFQHVGSILGVNKSTIHEHVKALVAKSYIGRRRDGTFHIIEQKGTGNG